MWRLDKADCSTDLGSVAYKLGSGDASSKQQYCTINDGSITETTSVCFSSCLRADGPLVIPGPELLHCPPSSSLHPSRQSRLIQGKIQRKRTLTAVSTADVSVSPSLLLISLYTVECDSRCRLILASPYGGNGPPRSDSRINKLRSSLLYKARAPHSRSWVRRFIARPHLRGRYQYCYLPRGFWSSQNHHNEVGGVQGSLGAASCQGVEKASLSCSRYAPSIGPSSSTSLTLR